MKDKWIGLDIGGTKCSVLLAEVDCGIRVLQKIRFETAVEQGFAPAWENICAAVEALLEKSGGGVRGIGVSCGGPLDSRRGVILNPPNLPGWENVPVTRLLEERFGVPAYLQNDANACALVEWRMGAGRGVDDMVFLTMGTGMGAGIISNGALVRGCGDMAGEVGHLRLDADGPVGYGKAGSFEGFASGGGMDRQARAFTRARAAAGRPPAWAAEVVSADDADVALIAKYARAGDADALQLMADAGRRLGEGVALIADTLNPRRVVIGSVFARCEDLLRGPMEAALQREALAQTCKDLEVLPAQTGEMLGDYAAVMVALEAQGVDPMAEAGETDPKVLYHFNRLLERYPRLEACRDSIMAAYAMLRDCYRRGGKLMAVGNGGSCADCEHIVGELMKGFYLKRPLPEDRREALHRALDELLPGASERFQQGLPAIALNGHMALTTAVQNDLDPLLGPAQQVVAIGRPGDVVLGISTSGNAKNVALAVSAGKALGLQTLGMTGGSGGRLAGLCDCAIIVPGNTSADVQELHLPVYHALCAMLEAKFFAE